ncbi:MAG TPA: hypothetical protein VIG06_06590 [Kofleriaceae bacterium]|jgi:hypothetical protein
MIRAALVAAAVAGCQASPPAPVTPMPAPAGGSPSADEGPAVAATADAGPAAWTADAGAARTGVLLTTTGNIDGAEGDESITFDADGTLRAGTLSTRVELPELNDYFWDKQAVLRTVVLDSAKKQIAIHLGVPTGDGEDPPNVERLFIARRGRLVKVFDQVIGVYTPTDLAFPGDGTLRYVEQGWTACNRAKHPATPVVKQEVVFRLNRAGTSMLEWKRIDTRDTQRCDELAACPFVYAIDESGAATRVGEILRDLRGARAYSLQSLWLPRGTTRIRLAEEKPEITYLDEVVLESGGVEMKPLACRGDPVPAYCAADRVPFVMRRGDTLDLVFEGAADGEVTLFARGYYLPL